MKGTVLFFDKLKGFGKVASKDNKTGEVFIHYSCINSEAKILLEGEEVEFDVKKTLKGLSANNLIRIVEREIGVVSEFDNGYGFISSASSNDKYFIHYTDVIGSGFRRIEVGYEVEFTPSVGERGLQAKQIVLRDTRSALEKFAAFDDWNAAIQDLAINHAQPEDGNWDYIQNKTHSYPVLKSYITYTFLQLQKENKIKFAKKNEGSKNFKYACFNTGLTTVKQEEIFAYFEHRDNQTLKKNLQDGYLKHPEWVFKCFDRESNRMMNCFLEKPDIANYFQKAEELIYDTTRRLIPDYEHIIDDREGRFPADFIKLSKSQQVERIKSAIDSALNRVRRNYKTAIPQFYNNSIQLLLPLCITTAESADVALVVARENEVYRANTVLSLDWAYNNARLLAKPDREWLNP